jgi:fatty acid desaturase
LHFYRVLEKFYVGDLVSNELPVYLHHGEFARTLKTRVKNQFKELKLNPKDARWTLLRYVSIVLSTAFFWYLQTFVYSGSLAGSLMVTIGLAISTSWSGLHMGHDSSHFSITNKPWVWKMVCFWTDILLGSSSLVWVYQVGCVNLDFVQLIALV